MGKERAKKTSTKKPKEKRVKKRKEMIKNFVNFLLSPNLVISYYIYQIRHLIIISALEIKQEEIDCVSSKKKPNPTREMPDQSLSKTTEHPLQSEKKNQSKRWCFLSNNKTKKTNPFFPL